MSEPLVVHLNREDLHDVVPATDAYAADGDFEVVFRNHGRAVHAHLKLEGSLGHVATLGEPNHFVGTDATKAVPISVESGTAPIEGTLEVVTGYGSEREQVAVSLGGTADGDAPAVEVDERLGDPDEETDFVDVLARPATARVAGFAAVAVLLAVVAVSVSQSPVVGLGAAVVLVAVAAAAYLLSD